MAERRRDSVLEVLETFRKVIPNLTVTDLLVFLYVSENPGINVVELSMAAGTTVATASRIARSLARAEAPGSLPPGLGLLELRSNPNYQNGRLIHLTAEGRALRDHVDRLIRDAVTIAA